MKTIKDLRTETGLSQAKFAELVEVPVANIRNWEQGIASPPEYVLKLIIRDLEHKNAINKIEV